jgi:hypothetical protein
MSYASLGTAPDVERWRTDAELAAEAGISPPMLRAIRQVESGASPRAVRFEPHVFHRPSMTGGRYRAQVPYTPGEGRAASSVRSETERAAFERARRLDAAAAVKSTSWGSYQVLGDKLIRLYGTPDAGVAAFDADPVTVSDRLLVAWMKSRPAAVAAARAGDFAGFARLYNGPAYYVRHYDQRLATAFRAAQEEWDGVAHLIGSPVGRATVTSAAVLATLAVAAAGAFAYWAWKKRHG